MSADFITMNILDAVKDVGEEQVGELLHDFSCPQNKEIETYLLKNALEFAKKKMSITYLVLDGNDDLVGYFTLAHKTSRIGSENLSKTSEKKIARFAKKDETTNSYDVSAFLIAQFGKNFSVSGGNGISGTVLMQYALTELKKAQHIVGGGVVFLECENHPKLLDFYKRNDFLKYGERQSAADGITYLQLMKLF